MNTNADEINKKIQNLLAVYPNLSIVESDIDHVKLNGTISIFRKSNDYTVNKEYKIEIVVPTDSAILPTIRDIGNYISPEYPHIYSDRSLCLETDTFIRLKFIDGFDLITWMRDLVEPFFFSYEYYSRYGEYPFDDRPHGIFGVIDTYCELFQAGDYKKTIYLMRYIAEERYRGHNLCPCNSGYRLRICHGNIIFPYMVDLRKNKIVVQDFQYIRKEMINEFKQSKANSYQTK